MSFSAPTDNGGSVITNYAYSIDGENYTDFSQVDTTSPVTITGLSVGTSYTVYLKAKNANGLGAASGSATATTKRVPTAPTGLSATSTSSSISVSFTQGADGGSVITNYSYSTDGENYTDFSPVDTTSPVTITSLTNGESYTIYLKAKNASGYSAASLAVTGTPNPPGDMIRTALTRPTQSSYDAASNESWIKITADEYSNLASSIASTTKVVASDTILNAATSSGVSYTTNAFVANHVASYQVKIPANSYLYAFAIRWSSKTPTNETSVYINNTTGYTGFSQVGGNLPDLVGGNPGAGLLLATNYYVLKNPTNTTPANGGILGFFSGMNNVDSYSSATFIGTVPRSDYGATPITRPGQGYHYITGLLEKPTTTTNMTGSLVDYGNNYAIGMQGLSTTVKQW